MGACLGGCRNADGPLRKSRPRRSFGGRFDIILGYMRPWMQPKAARCAHGTRPSGQPSASRTNHPARRCQGQRHPGRSTINMESLGRDFRDQLDDAGRQGARGRASKQSFEPGGLAKGSTCPAVNRAPRRVRARYNRCDVRWAYQTCQRSASWYQYELSRVRCVAPPWMRHHTWERTRPSRPFLPLITGAHPTVCPGPPSRRAYSLEEGRRGAE